MSFVKYHEGSQDDEEPSAHPRSHPTDFPAVHAEDPRHQEGTLCSSFAPSLNGVADVVCSQAIDHLLEKEYIERVEGTRDTFAYVA